MLKLYKSVMFGEASDALIIKFDDLKAYEKTALIPLMLLIIYIGLVPNGILETINIPARNLAEIYGAL